MSTYSGLNIAKTVLRVGNVNNKKGIDTATASNPIPYVLRPVRKTGADDLLSYFQNALPEILASTYPDDTITAPLPPVRNAWLFVSALPVAYLLLCGSCSLLRCS
jgi:hypothetical protein